MKNEQFHRASVLKDQDFNKKKFAFDVVFLAKYILLNLNSDEGLCTLLLEEGGGHNEPSVFRSVKSIEIFKSK